ncbi:MAG: MBL fold metallo-hydrolase [Bdellovibrionota bacterium]|nr:MAG: MBL fold metallo-hydrolase [Bdellovibrionota bacterium]
MQISVLSSGSRANATVIESKDRRVLIDCGLSARELERRLAFHRINPQSIEGILVTHEHSDHVRGLSVFSRRWGIPVFANELTQGELEEVYAIETIKTSGTFELGPFSISSFPVVHDALDPVAFVVRAEGMKFAQCTDLGRVTPEVLKALRGCHVVVLESNHDQEMLRTCDYPWPLKQRISSTHGHLSNDAAGALLAEIRHSELQRVFLGHLSENSNTPECALSTVLGYLDHVPSFIVECVGVESPTPLLAVG